MTESSRTELNSRQFMAQKPHLPAMVREAIQRMLILPGILLSFHLTQVEILACSESRSSSLSGEQAHW